MLSVREDPMNKYRTRNSDNTNQFRYNCGGYAFETFNWFLPYQFDFDNPDCDSERDMEILELLQSDFSIEEIYEEIEYRDIEHIKYVLGERVRVINTLEELCENEYAVAYRFYIHPNKEADFFEDDADDCFDYDFHFRKFMDGIWTEKLGCGSIEEIDWDEKNTDSWECSEELVYDSKTIFFAVKI